jgi:seryl-tRNA synthetase
MLDIKKIRENPKEIEARLKTKDEDIDLTHLVKLDERVREVKVEAEELKGEKNSASKEIGELKRGGQDASEMMERMHQVGERVKVLDGELRELEAEFEDCLARLPNLPDGDLKVSYDPGENVCIKSHLEKVELGFEAKNHLELNEGLGLFDFERGAKVAGHGWPAYRGLGARLEWALLQYMFDVQMRRGWEPWLLPLAVRSEIMRGSGHLPKFADQAFQVEGEELYLIPTAEAPLNGLFYDEILDEGELPVKYCAYSPCFRREAGAAGASERGLIRVHQFNKVELFAVCRPEESGVIFEEMVASAEAVLEGLGLHYRNMLLVTGDCSFASARTVDLEVWLPGQGRYYEVSSVSNCTDFQARRSKIRMRRRGEKPELVHTLNGSGVATARLMVAILENGQLEDGSVVVPEVLRKYIGGLERIESV